MNPVAVLFWGFMIGVPALAVLSLLRARRRQRGWVAVTARGVDPAHPGRAAGRGYEVAFGTPAGPVTATLGGPRPAWRNAPRRGEPVAVAYDPADPTRAEMAAAGPWHRGLLLVWSAVLAAVTLAFLFWSTRG